MGDRIVLDGELTLNIPLDGETIINSQIDGECEPIIKIKPILEPITVSQNGIYYPTADGFSSVTVDANIEDDYEWRKPDDWPDLESIELPHRDDVNTLYFLFDRSCGIDEVGFYLTGGNRYVGKGRIEDGNFIEEEQLSDSGHLYNFYDTLTNQYTVYKAQSGSDVSFNSNYKIGSAYTWYKQGCVWIYGELSQGAPGSQMTPFMRRMIFTRVKRNGHTFPNNFATGGGFNISTSYHIGSGDVLDDWDGLAIRRTGNGPITPLIKKKSDYVVKNITFNNQYERGNISAANLVLINPHGLLFANQYRYDQNIKKFVVIGGDLKARSNGMTNQFSYAYNLKICDIKDVDFSEMTSASSAFANCYNLQELYINNTWSVNLDLRQSPLLSTECAEGILDVLTTVTEKRTIYFHRQVYYRISENKINNAVEKGWTVSLSDYD